MPPKKSAKRKGKGVKKSKSVLAQEKLEAEVENFEKSKELHAVFVGRMNKWIFKNNSRAIDLFRKFDSNGDGLLCYEEFHAGMRDLDAPCSVIELHVLAKLLDRNKDGMIDYLEFSKGVRYYKPEETVTDDGLPTLQIYREELDSCANCQLKLWKPTDVKFPRFIQLDLRLLTFSRIQSYPGHFRMLIHTHMTVQGLVNTINERHGGTLRHTKIFDENENGDRISLEPHKTLEDCGYLGGPKPRPQHLELLYDYVTEFHECPILMADDYFTYENPKHLKFLA